MPINLASILNPSSAKIAQVADSAFDGPRFEFSDIIEGWHGAPLQQKDERHEDDRRERQEQQAESSSQQEQHTEEDLTLEMGDKSAKSANEGLPKTGAMPNPDDTGPVGPQILEGLIEHSFPVAALEGGSFSALESFESFGAATAPLSIDPQSFML